MTMNDNYENLNFEQMGNLRGVFAKEVLKILFYPGNPEFSGKFQGERPIF